MTNTQRRIPLRHDPEAGHPLVSRQEDISPAWLTAVLRASGMIRRARVIGARTCAIGNGMVGTNLRLDLAYDESEALAPSSLVVKLPATRPESRETGARMQVYLRETRFYQELAPTARIAVPETLFADISDDGQTFCLLFEDLAPARSGDQLLGCSAVDAAVVMDAAAALHAPAWGNPAIESWPWVNRESWTTLCSSLYLQCAPAVRGRYGAVLEPESLEVVEAFAHRIVDYFAMQTAPFTVTHQDFRLDNMMFDAKGGRIPVVVLDWQTVLPGPGASDVSYFIGAGLLPEDRRRHEETLVRRYHDALLALDVKAYSWTQCWRDYRLFAAQGLITAVGAAMVTSPTERGDRMFSTMLRRHAQHMIDHDTLALIG